MNKILSIVAVVFLGLIIFYLTQIHFDEDLFSDYNFPFTVSSMVALVGLLINLIFIRMNHLKNAKPQN